MQTLPQLYRWTRDEYEHLAELGFFEGKPVELIGGQIVTMSPKGPRHEAVAELVRLALAAAFPAGQAYVRKEAPLGLGAYDEPEPDAAVVVGGPRDYLTAHPTPAQTLLVVEVAETTRAFDLGGKADVYAAAGIDEYWVVCPAEDEVVVCRRQDPRWLRRPSRLPSRRGDHAAGWYRGGGGGRRAAAVGRAPRGRVRVRVDRATSPPRRWRTERPDHRPAGA